MFTWSQTSVASPRLCSCGRRGSTGLRPAEWAAGHASGTIETDGRLETGFCTVRGNSARGVAVFSERRPARVQCRGRPVASPGFPWPAGGLRRPNRRPRQSRSRRPLRLLIEGADRRSRRGGTVSKWLCTPAALVITQSITLYPGANTIYVGTPDASLAGKFLKLWVGGDGLTALSLSTAGSFVTPQSFAAGAITVGAVNGSDGIGNNIESFSSRGPITVAFPVPAKIQAPLLVAPDGIYVDAAGTYFASMLFPDGNFYGTSAAAPNAAAVAALIRGAFPNLTVSQLLAALEKGAAQLGSSVPDSTFGYGRVDATGALATLPGPSITALQDVSIDASSSTTSTAQPFTINATGTVHFSVQSTNNTLVPASLAASGSPGVTISPADCGSSTLTCSLTVTAAQYQGGTTTLTVSAVDGAGRAAPATLHVTVTNPQAAPPPVVVSAPKGGGGALGVGELVITAGLALSRLRRVSRRENRRLGAFGGAKSDPVFRAT